MNAAWPPSFCASAIMCRVSVVLPPDSGPYTSITRPRGNPPTPSAASMEIEPEGITLTGTRTSRLPRRMMEPLPCAFSIKDIAMSRFLVFSSFMEHLERAFVLGSAFAGRPATADIPATAGGPILPECGKGRPDCLRGGILAVGEEKAKIYY